MYKKVLLDPSTSRLKIAVKGLFCCTPVRRTRGRRIKTRKRRIVTAGLLVLHGNLPNTFTPVAILSWRQNNKTMGGLTVSAQKIRVKTTINNTAGEEEVAAA